MKLASEGKVTLEIDEEEARKAASDPELWRLEMLKAALKNVELNERLCDDHTRMDRKLDDNGKTLAKIAVALGILLSILTGASVVI